MEDGLVQRTKWLEKQCGFKLPPGLVALAVYLASGGRGLLDELKLRPAGPLAMLLAPQPPAALDDPTGLNVPFLEARHARDLPELFTFLEGREDGLHWALLWDRPDEAPRGVASFCSQDNLPMRLHTSVFSAVLECIADQLAAIPELIEDDPDHAAQHQARVPVLQNCDAALRQFAMQNRIPLDENRGRGPGSDTGLDLILPKGHEKGAPTLDGARRMDRPNDLRSAVQLALLECDRGRPYDALLLGRSLFFWKGAQERENAGVLMDKAYAAMGLHALARVLAAHMEQLEDLEGSHDSEMEEEEEEAD